MAKLYSKDAVIQGETMVVVKPTGCERWKALFEDTVNRGKIYDEFLEDRYLLTHHLHNCPRCENRVADISLDPDLALDDSMSHDEFAKTIRELYRLYKQKNQTP